MPCCFPMYLFSASLLIAGEQTKTVSHPTYAKRSLPIFSINYKILSIMRNHYPRGGRSMNQSAQKITLINNNNITIYQSFNPKKRNKSVEINKKKMSSQTKQVKESVIIEPQIFDLDFQMQKCREREMTLIRRNISLLKYYNSLISLFMITYTSCQVVVSNFFQIRKTTYFFPEMPGQFGINFIGLLLKVYEKVKNYQYQAKLRKLALNILKISPSASQFERKVEFISRKVVLNHEKMKEIEMSFMNFELQSFWDKLMNKVFISAQVEFMDDMFELEPEKLCVKNFQFLIQKYLSTAQFEIEIKIYQSLHMKEIAGSASHNFTIEFLLIQKLCSEDYDEKPYEDERQQSINKKKQYKCEIY